MHRTLDLWFFFEDLVSSHTFSAVMAVAFRYEHFCCLPQFFGNLWKYFFPKCFFFRENSSL